MIAQWLLVLLYLGIGVANIVRGLLAFVVEPVLFSFPLPLSLRLLGAVYVSLGLGFLVCAVAYLRRTRHVERWLVRGIAVVHQALVWTIRFVGYRATYVMRLWRRDLVLTILFLACVFLLTGLSPRCPSDQRR